MEYFIWFYVLFCVLLFLFHFYITDLTKTKQQNYQDIARSKFYTGSTVFVKETVCN